MHSDVCRTCKGRGTQVGHDFIGTDLRHVPYNSRIEVAVVTVIRTNIDRRASATHVVLTVPSGKVVLKLGIDPQVDQQTRRIQMQVSHA